MKWKVEYSKEAKKFIDEQNIWREVRRAAKKKVIYTEHALDEMNAEEELISEDKRGHSYLIFTYTSVGRPVHVICSPKEEYLGIITAYIPTLDKWENDFRTRRRSK